MKKRSPFPVSFFMPVYNEEENIESAVKTAMVQLKKISADFELILVDDGSTDKTISLIKHFVNRDKRIKLIQHFHNLGYGRALRTGIENASKKYTFYTDADNQFDLSHLPQIVKSVTPNRMIIGYRSLRKDSWQRHLMSRVYGGLIKLMFNLEVTDVNCSFKLFPTSLYRKFVLRSNTVLIDAEMIIRAKHAALEIIEVPVSHFRRTKGTSKFELGKKGTMMIIHPGKVLGILQEIVKFYPTLRGFSATAKTDKPNGNLNQSRK